MRGDIKYGDKDYARAAWSYAVALDKGYRKGMERHSRAPLSRVCL